MGDRVLPSTSERDARARVIPWCTDAPRTALNASSEQRQPRRSGVNSTHARPRPAPPSAPGRERVSEVVVTTSNPAGVVRSRGPSAGGRTPGSRPGRGSLDRRSICGSRGCSERRTIASGSTVGTSRSTPTGSSVRSRSTSSSGSATSLSGRVLELGSGAGRLTGYLAEISASVEGIDLSEEMVAYSRRRYPKATFAQGDLRDASVFGAAPYDAIVLAVQHRRRPERRGPARPARPPPWRPVARRHRRDVVPQPGVRAALDGPAPARRHVAGGSRLGASSGCLAGGGTDGGC